MKKGNKNNSQLDVRKRLIGIISSLLVICMMVSISYAFFVVLPGNPHDIATTTDIPSCASVTLSNESSLSLSGDFAAPISDKKALGSEYYAFNFKVTNACEAASSLKISIAPTIESTMPIRAIKYALVEAGATLPSEGEYLLQDDNQKLLTRQITTDVKKKTGKDVEVGYEILNSSLAAGGSKNYVLYVWVDYYEGDKSQSGQFNNTTLNKTFNAYFVVSDYAQTEGGDSVAYLSDKVLDLVSEEEYTSSQDSTPYIVRHETVKYNGETLDAGVRYEGKDPNNYIEFNGGEEWRIIGTFEGSTIGLESGKQYTKIIKSTSIGDMYWDYEATDTYPFYQSENDWSNSTINKYLNTEYLSSLKTSELIAKYNGNYSTWYLRGITSQQATNATSNDWYIYERFTGSAGYNNSVANASSTSATSAIALMYPSDYGYAAYGEGCESKSSLTEYGYYDADYKPVLVCSNVDWLRLARGMTGLITPRTDDAITIYTIMEYSNGALSYAELSSSTTIYPTLYLEADVYITDGTGTKADPYKIDRNTTLSETVLAQESDTEYTSSQDGTAYVIKRETAVGPTSDATYTKVNKFGTTKVYSAFNDYAVSGTDATGKLTMAADGTWTNNGTVTNTYYYAVMPIAEEGYYEICYTLGTGNTNNTLRAYITDSANSTRGTNVYLGGESNMAATSNNAKSGCTYVGYLTNEKAVRVVNRAYTSIASVSFYLQKTNETQSLDAGIRYEGSNPDNYVQFNGEEWRIIGTFEGSTIGLEPGKQYTKIIKNTPMYEAWDDYFYIDETDEEIYGENDWTNSTLNTYLNGEYLQGLNDKSKIAKYNGNYSTWHLRGMTYGQNYVSTTNDWYMAERVTGGAGYRDLVFGDADETTKSAIALMYPSDYGYAAYGEGCSKETTTLGSYGTIEYGEVVRCAGVDWLLLEEDYEWLLSPNLDDSNSAFNVSGGDGGYVSDDDVSNGYAVRPVLYLEASVQIAGGNGSKTNPYKLS